MKVPKSTTRYWEAMNARAFDSAVSAVVAFGSSASAHQAASEFNVSIAALTLQQFVIVFIGAFGWGVINYLHDHPLEKLLPAATTAESTATKEGK